MENLNFKLNHFREEAVLCDVNILSRDREHRAHKVILAACSDFFKTMFESSFREAQSGVITLKDISSELIEALLDYIYTGAIDINSMNACDLYCLADRFAVRELQQKCNCYLLENQDASNCLSIFRLARCYNDILLEKTVFDFILYNFMDFSRSEEFFDLSVDELAEIISQNELNIEKEEDVYEVVIKWADRDPTNRNTELPGVFKHIRFALMNLDFLEINVVSSSRVSDHKWTATIFDIYHRCCRYYRNNHERAFSWVPKDMPCYSRELRMPPYLIYVTGGWSNGRCVAVTECYNPKRNCWSVANSLRDPDGPKCYYGSTQIAKQAYYAGGYNGVAYLSTVRCFNSLTRSWSEVAPMHTKRCFNNLVCLKDKIYAIGGFDGVKRLSSVERYCSVSNQWTRIASLATARSDSSVIVAGDHIYVMGGFSGESLRSVEYFDGTVWRYTSPMNDRRSGAGAVTLPDGRIFVMGGYNGSTRQKTTEFFDIKSNVWIYGPSMHMTRSNFATCAAGGYVYAIGGYTGHSTLQDVEMYDIALNTWTKVAKLNCARSAMKACVLTGQHNLPDFRSVDTNNQNTIDSLFENISQNRVTV